MLIIMENNNLRTEENDNVSCFGFPYKNKLYAIEMNFTKKFVAIKTEKVIGIYEFCTDTQPCNPQTCNKMYDETGKYVGNHCCQGICSVDNETRLNTCNPNKELKNLVDIFIK